MVISEMDYNPYRFFLTQKFLGSYEMFSSEFAIFVGVFLPFCLSRGGVILECFFLVGRFKPAPSKGCQINPKGWLIDTP